METPLKVCVTGAAGQIADAFIPLLLSGQIFKNRKIQLRLLDTQRHQDNLKGLVMEIEDSLYSHIHSVITGFDPLEMFKDVDLIIFLGGHPRKEGMERKDLLQLNKEIFIKQGKALSVASSQVRCLVISNPTNTNAVILYHSSNGKVKPQNITCLSRLDHNRAVNQISIKTGASYSEIRNIAIFGNHSMNQYPVTEITTVKGKLLSDIVDQEWIDQTFVKTIQNRGGDIIKARNNTSVSSTAYAIRDHLSDWYYGTNGNVVSMGVRSEGDYNIPKGIWSSLPVTCDKGQYQIVKTILLRHFSEQKIKVTVQQLLEELKEAQLQL